MDFGKSMTAESRVARFMIIGANAFFRVLAVCCTTAASRPRVALYVVAHRHGLSGQSIQQARRREGTKVRFLECPTGYPYTYRAITRQVRPAGDDMIDYRRPVTAGGLAARGANCGQVRSTAGLVRLNRRIRIGSIIAMLQEAFTCVPVTVYHNITETLQMFAKNGYRQMDAPRCTTAVLPRRISDYIRHPARLMTDTCCPQIPVNRT
jgi:hypothetical protein